MGNVVVVGAQWGDEGKGKIVDWLSERADVIARFQGGHNAGHTLVIDGTVYKLSLLPSGIVRPGKLSVIGNGVVLDPWALLAEIEKLRGQGVAIAPDNLMIAENTPLILPLAPGSRPDARGGGGGGEDRHHRARHRAGLRGQGRAAQHPRRRSRRRRDAGDADRAAARASRRAAPRARRGADRPGGAKGARWWRWRRRCCPMPRRSGRCSPRRAARASASSSRGRRARCSTSTSAPILTSPPRTRSPAWPPPAPAWGRGRWGSCSASSRPIPPGSARGRSRPSSTTPSASGWASAAASSAPSPGGSAAAAGSTRCWCGRPAPPAASPASR